MTLRGRGLGCADLDAGEMGDPLNLFKCERHEKQRLFALHKVLKWKAL
jgi:hypothetical protein